MASEVSAHGHLALLPLDLRKAEYPVRKGMVKDAVHLIIAGKGRGEEEERKRERERQTDRKGLGSQYPFQGHTSSELTSSH
jgi:hypothetical protein